MKASCTYSRLTPQRRKHATVCDASGEMAARWEPRSKLHSHDRNLGTVGGNLFRTRKPCLRRHFLESDQASRPV